MGSNWQDTQRFLFWTHMLSGAAGHTYGAQGIWNMEDGSGEGVGDAGSWGDFTWREASQFPGSHQLGIGRKFLERYEWYKFENHPEWAKLESWDKSERILYQPYASGIPGEVRVIYIPNFAMVGCNFIKKIRLYDLEENINYKAHYFNPRTGMNLKEFEIKYNEYGKCILSIDFSETKREDYVLVLEKG